MTSTVKEADSPELFPTGDTDGAEIHQNLMRDGFAKLPALVSAAEVAELRSGVNALFNRSKRDWSEYARFSLAGVWEPSLFAGKGRSTNFFDFLGENSAIDRVVCSVLLDPKIQQTLSLALGAGYRLWYAHIRRAEPGSPPGVLHQDRPGEVGLTILMDDIPDVRGTTAFWKGSQRWPRLLSSFKFLNTQRCQRFMTGACGQPGDGYFFYNRTWHGMALPSEERRTALILTFLPAGAEEGVRIPTDRLLDRVAEPIRLALSGSMPTHSNAGPDPIVDETLEIGSLSPWRIPMGVMAIHDTLMAGYRLLRRGNPRI